MPLFTARPLFRGLQYVGAGLLDVVYPPRCPGCGARLPAPEAPLCGRCLLRLERARPETAAALLERLPADVRAPLDAVFALWHFDRGGTLQRVQHALKYGRRPRYGVVLGDLLGAAYRDEAALPAPEAVVPIPLHRARYLERGYNQSAELGRGVARTLGVPLRANALERPRPTRSQTRLNRAERRANVAGAFAVHGPSGADLTGRRVLLVDDVLTTGATVAAAAAVLHDAGAAHVAAATLALTRS